MRLILPYTVVFYGRAWQRQYWTQIVTAWSPFGTLKLRSTVGAN